MADTMYKYTRVTFDFGKQEKIDRYAYTSADLARIEIIIRNSYTTTFKNMDFMRGYELHEEKVNHNWHNELKWVGYTIMCRQQYMNSEGRFVDVYWGLERYTE